MQEDLITFETAKLAKEKGFDIPCRYSVTKENGQEEYEDSIHWTGDDFTVESMLEAKGNTGEDHFLAPTQSLLQKWLREVYNIIIYVKPGFDNLGKEEEYYWNIKIRNKIFIKDGGFKTHEEALEIGLQEALKLISDKNEKHTHITNR